MIRRDGESPNVLDQAAAHRRERPREETEARLLRERGTPEERIGPVVPDGTLYPQPEPSAATVCAGAVDPQSGVKCGWANGYQDCRVPGCAFAAWKTDERCLLVKRERGEA